MSARGKWPRAPLHERFMRRVSPEPNSGCWLWEGTIGLRGYGVCSTHGEARELAHRVAYKLFCGAIPQNGAICHRCDNPPCVNPEHLFLGTQADNIADMDRKGRRIRISAVPPQVIAGIRADTTTPHAAIARRFGISQKTVRNYRAGRTWSDAQ